MTNNQNAIRAYVVVVVLLAVASVAVSNHTAPVSFATLDLWDVFGFFLLGLVLELAEHRLATGEARGSIAFIVYMGATISSDTAPS